MSSLNKYEELTIAWSKDRGIIQNASDIVQTLKLVSEVGELADNINKGRDVRDDIGDNCVVLTNLLAIKGKTTISELYNEIK